MRTSMTAFTHPRTTRCLRIRPLTQHIYRYILLEVGVRLELQLCELGSSEGVYM